MGKEEKEIKKEKKQKSIVGYFFKMLIVFIIIFTITNLVGAILGGNLMYGKYGADTIAEIFWAFLVLLVMILYGNSYVFSQKKEKFFKSLIYGIPMLGVSIVFLIYSLMNADFSNVSGFINAIILCLFVGITEEFLCRGWLLNEFLERFSKNKKQIILSIVLSALVFGVMHISNAVLGQSLFETITQIINATAIGFLLGAIYYKTKNIWSVVFLHGFYDLCIYLGEVDAIKDCTTGTLTTSISIYSCISTLLLSVAWIFFGLIVLNSCKFDNKEETKSVFKSIFKKDNKINTKPIIYLILGIICFAVSCLYPIPDEYDDYYVCYSYDKITMVDVTESYVYVGSFDLEYTKTTSNDTVVDGVVVSTNQTDETFSYNISYNEDYQLVLTNVTTGDNLILDDEDDFFDTFEVIENENGYIILILDSTAGVIYYSDYMTYDSLSNDSSYLQQVKDSLKSYPVPTITGIGYVTVKGNNYKYPLVTSDLDYDFIIDEEGNLYLMTFEYGE